MTAGEPRPANRPRRSDLVLSLVLPLAVISLGVALSLGAEPMRAVVDLCLAAIR